MDYWPWQACFYKMETGKNMPFCTPITSLNCKSISVDTMIWEGPDNQVSDPLGWECGHPTRKASRIASHGRELISISFWLSDQLQKQRLWFVTLPSFCKFSQILIKRILKKLCLHKAKLMKKKKPQTSGYEWCRMWTVVTLGTPPRSPLSGRCTHFPSAENVGC